jgi:poly-gamma-glutamate capsule biosynthesis protein CapA/YwtB (metallophosphatase superfamily)
MGKAVAGIVRSDWSYNESRYYIEALNFYDEVIYVDPLKVTYALDRDDRSLRIHYEGYSLNELSMLYTFGKRNEILLLVKCLQMCGCPTSDPYHLISRESLAKLNDLLGLALSGIGTSAYVLVSLDAAVTYIRSLEEQCFPLLRKPIDGNKGRGIKKLGNREEALRVCRAHFKQSNDPLLLEKFMEYRQEYRVYIVDGVPVEAYEKTKKQGAVVSNLHQGGTVVAVESELKKELFGRVTKWLQNKFQTGIYGLDLAVTDRGDTHVIEINRTPGFTGLNRLGLLNLPRYAHEVIHKRARRPQAGEADNRADHLVLFVGDTNPGDTYQERLEAKGQGNILKEKGYDHSFENFRALLADADYVLANLEVSVTEHRESELAGIKPYLDRTAVKETGRLLKSLGINAVSLANNHTKDYGETGLVDTVTAMKEGGIDYFGAGLTAAEAASVVHHHVTIGNRVLHIIFAAGLEFRKNLTTWGYYADADNAGVNAWSISKAGNQLAALRRQFPEAYIVAFPHWGSNYQYVNERQKVLAKVLCDSGADLVIGHGSHMLQEITRYNGKWIVYGIGNFIYNSPGRYAKHNVLPFGLVGQLGLRQENDRIAGTLNLYPIQSDNNKTAHQPNFVSEKEFDEILKFYMPIKNPENGIQSLVKSGKDKWGYYLSIGLVIPINNHS